MKCSICSGTSCADRGRQRLPVRSAAAFLALVARSARSLHTPRACFRTTLLIGAAVRTRPAYDGSDSQQTRSDPRGEVLRQDLVCAHDAGRARRRREGRTRSRALSRGADRVRGRAYHERIRVSRRDYDVPDIAPARPFGLHLEWDAKVGPVPITLLARGRQHADSDHGAQADLRLTAGVYGDERHSRRRVRPGDLGERKIDPVLLRRHAAAVGGTGLPSFDAGSGPLVPRRRTALVGRSQPGMDAVWEPRSAPTCTATPRAVPSPSAARTPTRAWARVPVLRPRRVDPAAPAAPADGRRRRSIRSRARPRRGARGPRSRK